MDGSMDGWMDGWIDVCRYLNDNCKVQIFEMRLMLRESVNWEL